jgi:hypothetical protein
MPHYVQPPTNGQLQAHGLILGRLRSLADAAAAVAAIRAIAPPAILAIQTISHFENPAAPGGGGRPAGDRIGLFINATAPLQSAAAHAAMDTLVTTIQALQPASGPPAYFVTVEHY